MNRKQKRKLKRSAKVMVVCGAALYLATGVMSLGSKADTYEVKTGNVHAVQEAFAAIPIMTDETDPPEAMMMEMSYDWDADDAYLLAKIAMAEAEGEDTEGKALVMLVVLNRVWSDKFPNSIENVITENNGTTYQFSPVIPGGRWWTVEPDQDCWDALKLIEGGWDESLGALYFESQGVSDWHRRNLEFLFQHGSHYFYTEKAER